VNQIEKAARQFLSAIDARDVAAVAEVLAHDFVFLRPVRDGNREVGRQRFDGKDAFVDFLDERFTVRPSDHRVEVWVDNGSDGFVEGTIEYAEESLVIGYLARFRIDDAGALDYLNTTLYPLDA
jgi:ketosteroid isomerase-like protein